MHAASGECRAVLPAREGRHYVEAAVKTPSHLIELGSGPINEYDVCISLALEGFPMAELFLLSESQMARIAPHFPLAHGVPRVDDRRVVSGIVYVVAPE